MTLLQARIKARKYSKQYYSFWYVREMKDKTFQPWAHAPDPMESQYAVFYCGKEVINDCLI
jgi:hypothetical protein